MNEATRVWMTTELIADGLAALQSGGRDGAPLIDQRILSVKATPVDGSASDMSVGISVLPPGYSTPPHSHRAEELATVLSGSGAIIIDGDRYEVGPGSIVLTPSQSTHVTVSDDSAPLVIWWVYTPAGSETRWLEAGALDSGSGIRRPG